MPTHRHIEIDFDIHRLIENERRGFDETENSALRRLLKLDPEQYHDSGKPSQNGPKSPSSIGKSWHAEGVTLPNGTELRMRYNGRTKLGKILEGKWYVDNQNFTSPSGAASAVALTRKGNTTPLNGWNYWEVRRPGDNSWKLIRLLRPSPPNALTIEDLDAMFAEPNGQSTN